MRIGFWVTTAKRLDVNEISQGRIICGGAEYDMLNLAKHLHQMCATPDCAHPVCIFGNVKERGGVFNHALFFGYEDLPKILKHEDLEVLIVVRAHRQILSPRCNQIFFGERKPKKIVLWSGDSYDQANNEVLHDPAAVNNLDGFVVKSEWQKKVWLDNFPRLKNKRLKVIRRGLNLEVMPVERSTASAPRFIYASTAFRGLELFAGIWPQIKKAIPEATLDCYAKTSLYIDNNPRDDDYQMLYRQIGQLPGVTIKNPLPQSEFYVELQNYYAMLYPNVFNETVCGVALESMAAGVPVITSEKAGLIETIKDGKGVLIPGDPYSKEYAEKFVDATISLWNAKGARSTMSKEGFKKIREKYDIKKTSQEWYHFLNTL